MATLIHADQLRVWQALTDSDARIDWEEQILSRVDPGMGNPRADHAVHWRCRLGSVRLVMREVPFEIREPSRLATRICIGSLQYDQIYSLQSEPGESTRTRLALKHVISNSIPILGGVVDRFDVRRMATERIATSLRGVQKWCENRR